MQTVILISHKAEQCGIHEWGLDTYFSLTKSTNYHYIYKECSSSQEVLAAIKQEVPSAILYNCSAGTTPWLTKSLVELIRRMGIIQLGTNHTCAREHPDTAMASILDCELVLDPTSLESAFSVPVPRLIKSYPDLLPAPSEFTVGCFGFGMENKGWLELIHRVKSEFSEATINFLIPFNSVVDPGGVYHALPTAVKCRGIELPPGILLNISHQFLSKPELVRWLSGNSLNAFHYLPSKVGGISSVADHALSSGRPLAITKAQMFRHLHSCSPSICIEDRSLREIYEEGTAPLAPLLSEWSETKFVEYIDKRLDLLLK